MDDLTFDIEKHRYSYKGVPVPNVTSLLQEFGLLDLSGIPEERLKYKSALGTAVHYCIHLHESGDLDEDSVDPRIANYFSAYKKFCEVNRFEPRHTELRLYSRKFRFAGTLDLQGLLMHNGQEVESIIDIKCSWSLYPSNEVQLSAYKFLVEENLGIKIKKIFSLKLNANGNYDLVEHKYCINTFLAAVVLHHWKTENLKSAYRKEMSDL